MFSNPSGFWDFRRKHTSSTNVMRVTQTRSGCEGNLGSIKQGFLHFCGAGPAVVACTTTFGMHHFLWLTLQMPRNPHSYSISFPIQ
ncbi:hypothetical protein JCGZ_18129 [Jatropha curcas]|uniref:Uncharacterized protein n=1 Tax=Jatropha curcas TaxID=180498 RepID=A0A067KE54_JATCU|nr:hypothetical protein JCGZ_18129 [Jatropha curcas]